MRTLLFLILITCSTTAGYFAFRVGNQSAPVLVGIAVEPERIDFGQRGQGEVVEATYTLTNHFKYPIQIADVVVGCSCQTPSLSRKAIPPGETATVTIKWTTGARQGRVRDSVTVIHTVPNAGERALAQLPLVMEADIEPDIVAEPVSGTFFYGQPDTLRVKLSPGRQPAFQVKSVTSNSQSLVAVWDEKTSEIVIRYQPKGELDLGTGLAVLVRTDAPNVSLLSVPIAVQFGK